ncbi:MAG: T6SS immunity protein Tdi1 domain-containing protein [Gammaproteobacteria bacterium]
MALTLDDLTVSISHLDRASLLADWLWLTGATKQPVLVTALGNAFLLDSEDGSIHLLDVGPGTLQRVAASREEFRKLLRDKDFVVEHFVPVVLLKVRGAGHMLRAGQLYSFKTPPQHGGEYSADNLEPTDIEFHFSLLGKIHDRLRGTGVEPG